MITLFCVRPKAFNVGNDAIFLAMEHFIQEAFGRVVNLVSVPATARYESQARAGLTAKTIYEINQFGHGVIVGGGNLYENGELDLDVHALQSLEVPLMLFSMSWGRVYNRRRQLVPRTDAMPPDKILALNDRASFSVARDKATRDHLHSVGANDAVVGGCPTIFLDRAEHRFPPLTAPDEGTVLISIRHPELMSIPLSERAKVPGHIRAIMDFLHGEGHNDIRLLCHDHRDIPFAASFEGVEYLYTGDLYTYLSLLRSCALNVAYRLHSALPCVAFGRPVIKVSYDERALSLMEAVGLGDWNIDMVSSPDTVAEVIDRYTRLSDFDDVCASARMGWSDLCSLMSDTFSAFASEVSEYESAASAARQRHGDAANV